MGDASLGGGSLGPDGAATGGDYIDPLSTAMGRLTNAEYSQTVTDLTGEPPGAAGTTVPSIGPMAGGPPQIT